MVASELLVDFVIFGYWSTMADHLFVSDGEPMKFYMLPTQAADADSPHSKGNLKKLIEKHGGKMMDKWTRESHRLVAPGSNNAGIRTEVITTCIQNGSLVNFDLFYEDPAKVVDAMRKKRIEWTEAEDEACIEYILAHGDPEHKNGSKVPSATWFQEMETRLGKDKCNHSWESIKERTRKKLKIKLQNTAKTSAFISKRSRKKASGSASSSPRKRQATQKATPSKKQKKSADDEQAQPEKRNLRRGRPPMKKVATHMPSMGDEEELDEVDLALRMAAMEKSKPKPPTSKKTSTKNSDRVTDEEELEPRVTRARRKDISEPQSKKTKERDDNRVELHTNKTGRKAKQDSESNVETAIPPKRNNELETEEPEEEIDSDEDSEDLISENDIEFCDNFETARQALIFIQMETSCSFEEAHQALYNCSGNPKKALNFLKSPESTQCWARDHDKWVTSSDAKLIKKCETLYGEALVAERVEWLLT